MGRIRFAVQTGCNKLVKLGKITVFWYLCDKITQEDQLIDNNGNM